MTRQLLFEILTHRLWARILILFCSFSAAVFGLLSPYFQKEFIDSLLGTTTHRVAHLVSPDQPQWLILCAFFSLLVTQGLIQLTNYLSYNEALIMQRRLADRLYDKMLKMRVDTLSQRPLGQIVAIYATDVPGATVVLEQSLASGASTLFPLILAPVALSMLFDIPLWPTLLLMISVSSLITAMAFLQSRYFYKFKQLAAERIGLVNEWIQNMRTYRILSWIPYIENKIYDVREVETMNRVRMVTNGQLMNALSTTVTTALNVVTLGSFVFFSTENLSPGEMMALLWVLTVFLTRPFRQMPWFFTFAFDSWTSLRRLGEFLSLQDELPTAPGSPAIPLTMHQKSEPALQIEGLNLKINGKQLLQDISFSVQPGELVAIVGEVGAGKSILLLSLLRETAAHFKKFEIFGQDALRMKPDEVRGQFSYVPQEGFIMSASLRENVAFIYDVPMQEDPGISESLRLAQFDLAQEEGQISLETEIGERGVNLSGGQRQRVSLARVHYLGQSVILLDDCLSALDVGTEHRLLEALIKGAWREKTRVLVTHRLSVLPEVDRIFFMSHGRLLQVGTFEELSNTSVEFQNFTRSLSKVEENVHAEV